MTISIPLWTSDSLAQDEKGSLNSECSSTDFNETTGNPPLHTWLNEGASHPYRRQYRRTVLRLASGLGLCRFTVLLEDASNVHEHNDYEGLRVPPCPPTYIATCILTSRSTSVASTSWTFIWVRWIDVRIRCRNGDRNSQGKIYRKNVAYQSEANSSINPPKQFLELRIGFIYSSRARVFWV